MPERLVLCGGARRRGGDSTLRLALSGRTKNIIRRLEDLSRKLIKNVSACSSTSSRLPPTSMRPTKRPVAAEKHRPEWGLIGAAVFALSSR